MDWKYLGRFGWNRSIAMESGFGTELKVNVHIDEVDGIKMSDMDFTCTFFIYPQRNEIIEKSSMVKADEENYVAIVDSSKLGKGLIQCKIAVDIPDSDFPDGFRKEIVTVPTGIYIC